MSTLLESLPDELLIRVLCRVEHADLTPLLRVSKTIRRAALIAKRVHFKCSTPTKSIAFRNSIDLDESLNNSGDDFEAPGAPKLKRRRCEPRKTAALSLVLFTDDGKDARQEPDGWKIEFDGAASI